ncbi:DENN domain-containing protein 1B isoform X1 [Acipenser oxyrinchus oxyrinchus]|uniref:DENN domain-containing protein 1B isoform X1 n=1 Tax=Acipenser oxyrinchus oxyrinchus TaxID=40147 RepID=A0AAD8CLL7_ACIOX|nr:DENN domain-containing protein 1B isoform X1 [Acipenser oxyrinchus oxyrinchus]
MSTESQPLSTLYVFLSANLSLSADPEVLLQFPGDFNGQECLQTLPRFCFPFDVERVRESPVVQHFTFVLTDLEGQQRFGFCRLASRTCLCILSYLPWFEVFYKLLNNLADYLTKGQRSEMLDLLSALYKHPVPQLGSPALLTLGQQLQIIMGSQNGVTAGSPTIPYFIAPDPAGLPSIPESRNVTELVVSVDVTNMLHLYASLLFERRILLASSKLSTLTACVHASAAMLYPMYWQHIYIPVLPPHLLDYCCAPMPYLIGVHTSLMERVKSRALEDVVILNIDTNTLESPFEDLEKLPAEVVSHLKMRLKKQSGATGDGVARAFLRAQALLFGGYRDALACEGGDQIIFMEETFINHKSNPMKQFLQNAVHLQLFKQFIDNRLEKLNSGNGFGDVFEEEITHCGLSGGASKSHQQWVDNLKKGGGALIHTVRAKTKPGVRNMYKNAKGHAKLGLKEMKSRLKNRDSSEDRQLQRGGSLRCDLGSGPQFQRKIQSDCLQNRLPITQHFGKSRPRRPTRRFTSPLGESDAMDKNRAWALGWDEDYGPPDNGVQGAADDPGDTEDLSFLSGSSEMDLLGEIFDTLSTQTCQERGLLYGTRSLDLFSSDSSDYIRRVRSITPSNESLTSPPWRAGSDLGWELEEEDECSLEYGASSTDDTASEDLTAETTATQPGAGTLTVTCITGSSGEPDGNVLKRNSGRWDRGIAENEGKDGGEEGNSDPVAQTPTRIPSETQGAERGQTGSEDNPGSTGSAGKRDQGSTGSTVVQVQGSTGCTTSQKSTGSEDTDQGSTGSTTVDVQGSTSQKSTGSEDTDQGSTGSPKSISEDKEGVDIKVKTQGEATGNVDRAGNEVHCGSEDSASSSLCSANQQGDSAEELKQTPPREDSGTDQLQSPRVLSAVALFQAKGKSPEPRPGPARFGCIRRGADASPGRKSPAVDPAWNGSLETQAASLEALEPEKEPAVQSSPGLAPDPLPVKKVSELKKRFEA